MTYIAELDPNSRLNEARDAHMEAWDAEMPDWREREADPENSVSEADMERALQAEADALHNDWQEFLGSRCNRSANPGCICVETADERGIIHIPFVASWEVK